VGNTQENSGGIIEEKKVRSGGAGVSEQERWDARGVAEAPPPNAAQGGEMIDDLALRNK